ncbi:hypothetical protein L1049_006123 [Liquidambar formosana]|uniref:Uncharacterized protein n=1 Tax=Liquidambar formosana TaxID=63359 RepID=A0AAP0RGE8_LIQFO
MASLKPEKPAAAQSLKKEPANACECKGSVSVPASAPASAPASKPVPTPVPKPVSKPASVPVPASRVSKPASAPVPTPTFRSAPMKKGK